MAVLVCRKKQKLSKKLRHGEVGLFSSFLEKIFPRLPAAFFIILFIYIWSSSTTILSGHIVHVCVSSRKLNNLYCLSAGAQPSFDIPVSLVNDASSEGEAAAFGTGSSSYTHNVEVSDAFGSKDSTLAVKGDSSAEEVVNSAFAVSSSSAVEDADDFVDSKNLTLVVKGSSSAEEVADNKNLAPAVNNSSSAEEAADFVDNKNLTLVVKGSSSAEEVDSKNSVPAVNETIEYAHREAEEQIQLQRSWNSGSNLATCEGRGIYVYELPSKFNKDLTAQCKDTIPWLDFCNYLSNDGLGERIEGLGRGWHNIHQYALEPIFHARILKHPCRVHDRKEARLFYVPYYGGLDVLRWHFKNVSSDTKDSLGIDLIRWLETQTSWYNNLGKDHVFVLGKISWDFRRNGHGPWGTRLLELDEMQNPVKLLIERHPWESNDVGVPHPTFFHPHTDDDIVSWQLKTSRASRGNLVGFAGAARPGSTESIRSILIEQCTSAGDGKCKFLNCTSGQCDRPESIVGLFTESEFCLQPTGDSPTRKSVFDSLISGCIPVMFDPFTAYYQYPWHLPEDRDKYSVFIDKEEVRKKSVNVVDRLMKISPRDREKMRRYIIYELLPGLVYGDLDSKFHKFQDAFSIAINSLLDRVSRLNNV